MSAPDTNIAEQKKKHKTPLAGMMLVGAFAGALLLGLIAWLAYAGNEPEDTGPQVEVVPGVGATLEEN